MKKYRYHAVHTVPWFGCGAARTYFYYYFFSPSFENENDSSFACSTIVAVENENPVQNDNEIVNIVMSNRVSKSELFIRKMIDRIRINLKKL